MKHLRLGTRVLLLLMMVVSGFLGSTGAGRVLAQGGGSTFVSPMTGIPITASGPWTVDPASVMSEGGIESVTLEGEYEFMQVWFMPGDVDLVEARDVVLDSFAQTFGTFVEIDRGAYGNVSYSLDITSSEGVEFGVFSLFLGQRESGYVEYYVYFGALSLFAQGFASAQQNVTVNGAAVFDGVDGVGLQNLLLANAGVTGASPSTTTQAPPVPTSEPQQPAQPTQPTPPPATEGGPASNDGAIYLQALQGETAYLQTTINDFLNNYMLMDSNAETAVPELDRVAGEWRAYPQRAAAIVAPAGFETLDASYRAIATEAEALAGLWDGVIQSAQAQDGTTGTKMADLVLRVMSFQVMIDDLNTAISTAGGQSTTTTTEQPTQAPADTTTQQTGGLSPEQSAYLQSVRGEADTLEGSIYEFLELFGSITSGANNDQAIAGIQTIMTTWASYPDTAATLVAPAGLEDVGTQYQAVANQFPTAAATFQTAMQAIADGDQATVDATLEELSTQLETLLADITALRGLIDQHEAAEASTSTTTTTEQPTQAPADTPSQPTGGLNAEQMAYVQTVRSEISMLQTSMDDFQTTFTSYLEETAPNPDQAIQEINATIDMWAAYPQTASTIVAPAGMEDVGTAYQNIASGISTASGTFTAAIQAGADGDSAGSQALMQDFIDQLGAVYTQIADLNTLLDQYEQSGSTTGQTDVTTQPTAEAQPTQETTTTDTGDGDAYIAAISGETQAIMDSIVMFAEGFELLGSTDTAEQDQGVAQVNEVVTYWSTYDQVAAGIVAPAGYEDVDAAYRQLATDVTGLATLFNAWIDAPEASREAAAGEFSAAFDSVQTQIEELNAMVGGGSTGTTSTTPSEQQDVPADITETGNRGELPQFPSQDDDPQDTGGAGEVDYEDLGLVSESEYVSPQFGIEVVWDDRWAFDGEAIEDPIGSDEDNGQDWISLAWTSGDAGVITISLGAEGSYDLEEMVAEWESDALGSSGEVLLAEVSNDRGGVLVLVDDAEGTVLYQEAVCLSRACDEVAVVTVTTSSIDASDVIGDAEEGIEIEGEAATGVFSARQIDRALDQ